MTRQRDLALAGQADAEFAEKRKNVRVLAPKYLNSWKAETKCAMPG
jgi:hypothetical protein